MTHDLGRWLFGKPMVMMVDILFALIELFSLSIMVSYEAKCVQLGCFRRGLTSLHTNLTWTGTFPINHSWCQKTKDAGQPDDDKSSS